MYYLGIDLGGTNIACGIVNENYEIIGRGRVKTNLPRPAAEIADDIFNASMMAIENAGVKKEDIKFAGIGSPGAIDAKNGIVSYANNLGFNNVPLKKLVEERLNIETFIENDANAAAYGEMLAGAGKGTKDFVAITLGTGVGGGVIIGGKILSGYNSAGAELGHTVINIDGEPCTCGRNGCWEAYASATALIRQTKREMLNNKNSLMWELTDGNIDNVNGITAFDAMRQNDESGTAVVDNYIKYVAVGVVNMINIFQPQVLCIGGGISKEGDTLLNPIRAFAEKERYSKNIKVQTEVKAAELGNDAGIIGAAFLGEL